MSDWFLLFTAEVENTWSIDEILKKVQSTSTRRNEWRVAFKEGVDISERVIQDTFGQQDEQDYIARYDLSYLTPRSQPIRCKVRKQIKWFFLLVYSPLVQHSCILFDRDKSIEE